MVDNKDFKGKSKSKPVKSDIVNVPLNQAAVLAVAEEVVGGPAKKFGKDNWSTGANTASVIWPT